MMLQGPSTSRGVQILQLNMDQGVQIFGPGGTILGGSVFFVTGHSHSNAWPSSALSHAGPRPHRHNSSRPHRASAEPTRGPVTILPRARHSGAASRKRAAAGESRGSPNPFSNSFRIVWGTRYTTSISSMRAAIAGILKEQFSDDINVAKGGRARQAGGSQ